MALAAAVGRVAVSDGASESFDSRTWASLLVAKFLDDPGLCVSWLDDAVTSYAQQFAVSDMSWSQQAAFERGSYATLLGVEHSHLDHSVTIQCVGDSLAVLLDDGEFVDSFYYRRAEAFQARPELLCTNPGRNRPFALPHYFRIHRQSWSLGRRSAPVVLCMTDAVGQWALRRHQRREPVWQELMRIDDAAAFETLVLDGRVSSGMRVDDATLVRVSFDDDEDDGVPVF